MRNWLDTLTCAVFCSVVIATWLFAQRYVGVAAPASVAGSITYLWATRWRHRGE
jgi:hypothetical protein